MSAVRSGLAAVGRAPVIRPLRPDDIDDLADIEQRNYPFPWSRGILADCLELGCLARGIEWRGRLVGYAFVAHGAGEAHLLNLCIDSAARRRGLGGMLLDHVIGCCTQLGCRVLFLEVRPSNPVARRLYQRRGFREIGVRPDYYPAAGGREDAHVLELQLSD